MSTVLMKFRAMLGDKKTVLTMQGPGMTSDIMAIVHVTTWLSALIMIAAWGNSELTKLANVNDSAIILGWVYFSFILAILAVIVLHATLVIPEDTFLFPLASAVLLTLVGFANIMGCAYLSYALSMPSPHFYGAALVIQLFVGVASGIVVTLYVTSAVYD